MYLIAGLGNLSPRYDKTRHNIGFEMVDSLAARHNISFGKSGLKGLVGKGVIGGEKVILVKPATYMNLSGECIRAVCDYYRIEPEQVIILFDDISLDVGRIRIRKKGSAGGHNGIKSIIAHLGSDNFMRLKFGVGDKPAGADLADYVLGHFNREEAALISERLPVVCDAVECMLTEGADSAMNKYNG